MSSLEVYTKTVCVVHNSTLLTSVRCLLYLCSLRGQCSGEAFGDITKYELKPEHDPTQISW